MSYTPNFSDPRVVKRVRKALGFARSCFSETKPRQWSTRYIDKHFGPQTNALSKWLRQQLLVTTNAWWSKDQGKCKEYVLNGSGYEQLAQQLKSDNDAVICVYDLSKELVLDWAKEEFKDELATKVFNYNDKSSRLWHPLQNVRKEYKRDILAQANFKYEYDIQCCAPTLIMQLAQRHDMHLYLPHISGYLANRKYCREQIALNVELDPSAIKVIINALFSGAKLGMNPTFDIYKMLNGDRARITYLKQDPYLTGLREEIKICWDYIKTGLPRRSVVNKNNKEQMLPISSRQKWGVYFDLERVVLNAVMNYLKLTENQFFAEHDGWTTTDEVDQNELIDYVFQTTGYRIKIDMNLIQ